MKKRMVAFALVLSMLLGLCMGIPMPQRVEASTKVQPMVAAGKSFSVALNENGEVWTWGDNYYGQLGNGTLTDSYTPIQVKITDVKQVAAGYTHTVVLKENGEVWAWGNNEYGQLGDGTLTDSYSPVQVQITDVKQVVASFRYTAALKENGEVWAWGYDEWGRLFGKCEPGRYPLPVQIDITDVKQIGANPDFIAALKENGEVWAWGAMEIVSMNYAFSNRAPEKCDIEGVKQITVGSGGSAFIVALKENGEVWAWGSNGGGQLGIGKGVGSSIPIKVNIKDVKQVATGGLHTVALKENGEVWAWGFNHSGSVGDGTGEVQYKPVLIDIKDVNQVAANLDHTLALKENGEVWGWGSLRCGLGGEQYYPVQVQLNLGTGNFVEGDLTAQYRSDLLSCDKDLTFFYSDKFFGEKNGDAYNHELARASLALELSSWTAHGADGGTESARMRNISNLYTQMKFDENSIAPYNYDVSLDDNSDKVAYSFATKKLYDGSTLVAVVVRGGGYGAEWRSNLHVGSGDMHYGFQLPALNVYADLLEYTKDMDKSKLKLWVTGYSRGAAVANIVSGRINEDNLVERANLYTYTFATPNGVKVADVGAYASIHDNIYNIVLPGDFVPKVAMEAWGYGRYGQTLTVKNSITPSQLLDTMLTPEAVRFQADTGMVYGIGTETTYAANRLTNALVAFGENQNNYVVQYEGLMMDLIEWLEYRKRAKGEDLTDFVFARYRSDERFSDALNHAYIASSEIDYYDLNFLGSFVHFNQSDVLSLIALMYMNGLEMSAKETKQFLIGKFFNILKAMHGVVDLTASAASMKTHHPEYYIAWLYAYDNSKHLYQDSPYKKLTIACPVNVNVYDANGELVASVVENKVVVDTLPIDVIGESAEIYFYEGEDIDDYTIEIEAYEEGKVNYSVTEYETDGTETRKINYADIPVVTGTKLSGAVPKGQQLAAETYNLMAVTNGEQTAVAYTEDLSGEDLQNLNVEVTVEGDGIASDIYFATKGELVTLEAEPYFDASFIGWYDAKGDLISTQLQHSFVLKESLNVTAKFTKCTAVRFTNIPKIADDGLSVQGVVSSAKDISAMCIIAVYSENDALLYTKIAPVSLQANTEQEIGTEFDTTVRDEEPSYVKLYLWKDFYSLANLCEGKTQKVWNTMIE